MKFFFTLVLLSLTLSCSNDSDNFIEFEELGAITAVEGPDQVTVGQTAEFVVTFEVPTTCHSFQRLDFAANTTERVVAVVFAITDNDCNPLNNFTEEVTFNITPDSPGTILFKFFAGNDPQGQPTFIEKEVTVVTPG